GAKGYVSVEDVLEAITPRTALVSLCAANALTGVINPCSAIAELCEERGIYLHFEISQLIGRSHIDVEELGAELISFGGEHLHGPKGTGLLWMKRGTELSPFIVGGSDQGGRRAGTLNNPGLAGLAEAARLAMDNLDHVCLETARLRDKFETEVLRIFPKAQVCFKDLERTPTTSCIAFPGIANEALLYYLNKRGVYACIGGGGQQQIALVLKAAGFDEEVANCALSFSLSGETTEAEIDEALAALDESVHQLQRLSNECYENGE
ncbi:MAG: aminotransferase class V-fold PLP-dependent enzyme, partial [Chlamydiia bacterium]|nr:aminotransferase class V-fold PLP-dependent enzyme [Chlamydiia bacterium]